MSSDTTPTNAPDATPVEDDDVQGHRFAARADDFDQAEGDDASVAKVAKVAKVARVAR